MPKLKKNKWHRPFMRQNCPRHPCTDHGSDGHAVDGVADMGAGLRNGSGSTEAGGRTCQRAGRDGTNGRADV